MKEVNDDNFDQTVLKSDKLVVCDCFAVWCGPCKMVAPILEDLSTQYTDVEFVKCDVDESPNVSMKYGIRNIPTILFLKNGEMVDKQIGAVAKQTFENKIKKLL